MRNWWIVRTGSTSSQKSLFFDLRRVRAQPEREAGADGERPDRHPLRQLISPEVGVPLRDIEMMEGRLFGSDFSLNATQAGEEGRESLEKLEDQAPQAAEPSPATRTSAGCAAGSPTRCVAQRRERLIIVERKLRDEPRTLESLGQELGLSKERIRQLEAQALTKLRKRLEGMTARRRRC